MLQIRVARHMRSISRLIICQIYTEFIAFLSTPSILAFSPTRSMSSMSRRAHGGLRGSGRGGSPVASDDG